MSDTPDNMEPEEQQPKRRIFTRRRVLVGVGGLVGAAAVGAGGVYVMDNRRRFGRDALHTIRDHRVKLPPTAPRMVISRGADPASNVRAVLDRFGGASAFIEPGETVLVKPNIGWNRRADQAANTHPSVVGALVTACKEAGAGRVIVSDCPMGSKKEPFRRSGILKAAVDAGAEVIAPGEVGYHTVKLSDRLGTWDVLQPFVTADKIINVPVAKHHGETWITGGMKNWIGITDKLRISFHGDIDRSIAELAALMRPTLTVMDASRVLMQHGPQGGSLADVKQVNIVAGSVDEVALDAWACGLLGTPRGKLPPYLALGEAMGVGVVDYKTLGPVEVTSG